LENIGHFTIPPFKFVGWINGTVLDDGYRLMNSDARKSTTLPVEIFKPMSSSRDLSEDILKEI
jgi:hypothetical protein